MLSADNSKWDERAADRGNTGRGGDFGVDPLPMLSQVLTDGRTVHWGALGEFRCNLGAGLGRSMRG